MERVTLVTVHNAFERSGRDTRTVEPGLTLAELRTLHLPAGVDFALSVNGHVASDLSVVPRAGALVLAVPVISGSDDGKMIGRLIGMILVTVIATIAQQHWATTLIWGMNAGYLAAGAIMLVGGVLVNMAFAASGPNGNNLPAYGNDAGSSPAYGWAPQSTQQQGTVIPKWYGRNKLYGNIIVATIDYSGNDSYINALIDLGLGPYSALSDFKVNDQPIENFMGISAPDQRLGLLDQAVVTNFAATTVEYNTSQLAAYGAPVIYTTQGNSFDRLEVLVQFPALGYYNDQGNIVNYSVNYRVSYKRHGDAEYTIITFQPYDYYTSNGGMWTYGFWTTGEGRFDEWEGWIPGETFFTVVGGGSSEFGDHTEGEDYLGYLWHWIGEPSTLSTGIHDWATATAAQSTPYRVNYVIPITVADYYDIKVERLTNDFTSNREMGQLYLSTIKEITSQSFTYPRKVLVGLKALASNQLSGSLRFSCIADCSIVRVWDGSAWSAAYSTNPAWVCFDVLTQPVFDNDQAVVRYDGIDPARIDHVRFKEWADYCDELLPDGNGGTEKRIEFNGGFDSEMSLWEAVLRICSVAYAAPVWNGIKLTVSIDKPADPVQLFSLGNIDQDSFKETFLSMEDRAAEIEVDYINRDNNYQRDKLTVVNTDMTTVTSKVSLSLFGITKASMAWRAAMRRLAYNQLISRTIDFGADIDAIACTIGDVILVQHDVPQWGYGGRLVAATTGSVTIDQTITLEAGVQYAILVRLGDDSLEERDITNVAGDANTTAGGVANTLTVSPAFTSAPVQFDVFTVGRVSTTAKPFRVTSIARSSDLKAQISAVEYVAGVYAVDSGAPAIPAPDYTLPLASYRQSLPPFEAIIGITVTESIRKHVFGIVYTQVTLHWTPAVNRYAFPAVEIWAWMDGAVPQKQHYTPITTNSFDVIIPVDGCYWNFVVGAVNLNGEAQKMSDLLPVRQYIHGKTTPPGDVSGLDATLNISGALQLSWTPVPDLDIAEYLIRYSPLTSGADWYSSTELLRTTSNSAGIPLAQTGTYMIKAVDTTGHESNTAAQEVLATVASIIGTTPHATIAEHPLWTGTKTNLAGPSGGILTVSGTPTANVISAEYTAATEVDFGSVKTARVTAQCDWLTVALGGDFDAIADFDAMYGMDGQTGLSNVQAYIYTSQTASAPTYKQPLFAGDYTFRRAKFTIEVSDRLPDLLQVNTLTVQVDTIP